MVNIQLTEDQLEALEMRLEVDTAKLPDQDVKILKAIKREGEKHLKYFYDTMKNFSNPERRVKCFDTKYYEDALPHIERILRERAEMEMLLKQ